MIDIIYNFINQYGTVINTIINIMLLSVGVISIYVIWRIYKIQKRDQRDYLEYRKEQDDKKRRNDIKPIVLSFGGGSNGGSSFHIDFKIILNDAFNVYFDIIDISNISSLNTIKYDRIRNNDEKENSYISLKGYTKLNEYIHKEKPTYSFYIYFSDIDKNKYRAKIVCIGTDSKIGEPEYLDNKYF